MADPAPQGARRRQRIAAVALAATILVGGAVLLAVAPGARAARAATPTPAPTPCPTLPSPLPTLPNCPSPTASPATPTPQPTPSPTASPPPTTTNSGSPPPSSGPSPSSSSSSSNLTFNNPTDFPTPPPPLPTAPGAPPQPPELQVQTIVLSPATAGPVPAGSTVAVQATMEAKRGADLYSVPHAAATFSIISSSGQGARVTPSTGTADDTGTLVANVVTGDQPGDTVVGATSGAASAQLILHSTADTTLSASSSGVVAGGGGGSSGVQRPLLIAGLAAISAAVIVGLLARAGRLPGFRKRGGIWGRHTSS